MKLRSSQLGLCMQVANRSHGIWHGESITVAVVPNRADVNDSGSVCLKNTLEMALLGHPSQGR